MTCAIHNHARHNHIDGTSDTSHGNNNHNQIRHIRASSPVTVTFPRGAGRPSANRGNRGSKGFRRHRGRFSHGSSPEDRPAKARRFGRAILIFDRNRVGNRGRQRKKGDSGGRGWLPVRPLNPRRSAGQSTSGKSPPKFLTGGNTSQLLTGQVTYIESGIEETRGARKLEAARPVPRRLNLQDRSAKAPLAGEITTNFRSGKMPLNS